MIRRGKNGTILDETHCVMLSMIFTFCVSFMLGDQTSNISNREKCEIRVIYTIL